MSILLRAALLGGIAYLITRSLSGPSMQRRTSLAGDRSWPRGEVHPDEHVWPTSESQERVTANAGPASS